MSLLTLGPEKIRLNQEPTYLTASQNFHFGPDPDFAKEWKVKTDGYAYHVFTTEDEAGQLFGWHWHPQFGHSCHVHIGPRQGKSRALYRLHVPSGRAAFEEVLRFLIEDVGVRTARKDWDAILSVSVSTIRRWLNVTPSPGTWSCGQSWRPGGAPLPQIASGDIPQHWDITASCSSTS
jgi:hypothetical protein